MFGGIQVLKIFGIPIKIDASWVVLLLLITWSLATAIFPTHYPDLGTATYWVMGFVAAIALLLSILLHELGHAVVAQACQIKMRRITLFIFGGLAEMANEPPNAKAEFLVAVAGPLVSIAIAIFSILCAGMVATTDALLPSFAVLLYVGLMNAVLVVFNLIPAFPLDGGRVLRSILWLMWDDLTAATRVTTAMGTGFGTALILLGVFTMIGGSIIAGIWQAVIGLFLRGAANMSYQQLLVRNALRGETIGRFMQTDIKSVPPDLTIRQLVDEHVYRYQHKMYPVMDCDEVRGCITTRDIKQVPISTWSHRNVSDIAQPCSEENTIDRHEDAYRALSKMNSSGNSRLMVTDHNQLVGVVSLKDLLGFIAMKIELEEASEVRQRKTDNSARHAA